MLTQAVGRSTQPLSVRRRKELLENSFPFKRANDFLGGDVDDLNPTFGETGKRLAFWTPGCPCIVLPENYRIAAICISDDEIKSSIRVVVHFGGSGNPIVKDFLSVGSKAGRGFVEVSRIGDVFSRRPIGPHQKQIPVSLSASRAEHNPTLSSNLLGQPCLRAIGLFLCCREVLARIDCAEQ